MDNTELREICEKLKEEIRPNNEGRLTEYPSLYELERRRTYYVLYLALCDFMDNEL